MNYLNAFITGGLLCAIAQVLIDRTGMTAARILVLYVVSGVVLTFIGVYEPLVEFGGCGATVPITGFGYALAKGVERDIIEKGMIGVFTGGLGATAAGITVSMCAAFIAALTVKSRPEQVVTPRSERRTSRRPR